MQTRRKTPPDCSNDETYARVLAAALAQEDLQWQAQSRRKSARSSTFDRDDSSEVSPSSSQTASPRCQATPFELAEEDGTTEQTSRKCDGFDKRHSTLAGPDAVQIIRPGSSPKRKKSGMEFEKAQQMEYGSNKQLKRNRIDGMRITVTKICQ